MAEYDPPESSFLIWMNTHSFSFFISLVLLMLIYTMARTSAAAVGAALYSNIISLRFVILVLLVIQCESCFIFFLVIIRFGVLEYGGQGKGDIICLLIDAFSASRL